MTNSNTAQVDNQLSQIYDALGEYAAPLPQIDNLAITREQAISLLDQATALDADAAQLREQREGQHDAATLEFLHPQEGGGAHGFAPRHFASRVRCIRSPLSSASSS